MDPITIEGFTEDVVAEIFRLQPLTVSAKAETTSGLEEEPSTEETAPLSAKAETSAGIETERLADETAIRGSPVVSQTEAINYPMYGKSATKDEDEATSRLADEISRSHSIKEALCPKLIGLADDVFDLTREIAPVLVGLAAAGALPLHATLLAYLALIIARQGVAAFCSGVNGRHETPA